MSHTSLRNFCMVCEKCPLYQVSYFHFAQHAKISHPLRNPPHHFENYSSRATNSHTLRISTRFANFQRVCEKLTLRKSHFAKIPLCEKFHFVTLRIPLCEFCKKKYLRIFAKLLHDCENFTLKPQFPSRGITSSLYFRLQLKH